MVVWQENATPCKADPSGASLSTQGTCAHDQELSEAGGGSWHLNLVGGAVSLSQS